MDAQLGREFAERDAERAGEFTKFLSESRELERQRDERERECAQEQDGRERERDAKWDARLRYFEEREVRPRWLIYAGFGIGIGALGLLVSMLALVA